MRGPSLRERELCHTLRTVTRAAPSLMVIVRRGRSSEDLAQLEIPARNNISGIRRSVFVQFSVNQLVEVAIIRGVRQIAMGQRAIKRILERRDHIST